MLKGIRIAYVEIIRHVIPKVLRNVVVENKIYRTAETVSNMALDF